MLERDEVVGAISPIAALIETNRDDVRIVGTASSLLRGIELPVGDVDILVRQRALVDELTARAIESGGRARIAPEWLAHPGFGQYFSEVDVSGIRVEICTVEPMPGERLPFGECDGDSPWNHFDLVRIDGRDLPLVASELRLFTEVVRLRPDCYSPIGAQMRRDGFDDELFGTALLRLPTELQQVMRDAVAATSLDQGEEA